MRYFKSLAGVWIALGVVFSIPSFIVCFFLAAPKVFASTEYEFSKTKNTYLNCSDNSNNTLCDQTFTASTTAHTLSSVILWLAKDVDHTPDCLINTGSVQVGLRATSAGVMTGSDLATSNADACLGNVSNNASVGGATTFTFSSPYSLTPGTLYALVLEFNTSGQWLEWFTDSTNPYSGGICSRSDGIGTGYDCYFDNYGDPVGGGGGGGGSSNSSTTPGYFSLPPAASLLNGTYGFSLGTLSSIYGFFEIILGWSLGLLIVVLVIEILKRGVKAIKRP